MRLPELAQLEPALKADGVCISVFQKSADGQAGSYYGWVLTVAGEVQCWDGWYTHGGDSLQPLLPASEEPIDYEHVRFLNRQQIGPAIRRALVPLHEFGFHGMVDRAGNDDPNGWGPTALQRNVHFDGSQLVAVVAFGGPNDLRDVADLEQPKSF